MIYKLFNNSFYYSIMECEKNDMNYESVTSHHVTPDLNKDISVTCLQKELEILRTRNQKV